MPSVAEPRAPIAADLSQAPSWFEDAVEEDVPVGAFFWATYGKIVRGPNGTKPGLYDKHLKIHRHKEDADRSAREPNPFWEWDRLPPFHITPEQALGMAKRRGFAGVVLQSWDGEGWLTLKTWAA